jgi:hypothetical protein
VAEHLFAGWGRLAFGGRGGKMAGMNTASNLLWKIRPLLDKLEAELVKPCVADELGIVTNHMQAAWELRDSLNDLLREGVPVESACQ